MVATRLSNSIGLASNSSHPVAMAAALLAVLRCENLEAAAQLEARLEHVQVVVVVFDVEHFGHDQPLFRSALHSITSSARASRVSGTVRPSALAVVRLITNSYLVGACTGSSAGLSPLRMRSTYAAARLNW